MLMESMMQTVLRTSCQDGEKVSFQVFSAAEKALGSDA